MRPIRNALSAAACSRGSRLVCLRDLIARRRADLNHAIEHPVAAGRCYLRVAHRAVTIWSFGQSGENGGFPKRQLEISFESSMFLATWWVIVDAPTGRRFSLNRLTLVNAARTIDSGSIP